MAAGLRPDLLGELKRSPDPLVAIRGPTSKRRGKERKGREKGKGGKGRREGQAPPDVMSGYAYAKDLFQWVVIKFQTVSIQP